MKNNAPLISICCVAYNQKQFIEKTLSGFLMQETEYPFEIIVHDDASTDGTAEIIRSYADRFPTIIKAYFEETNQFSQGKDIWRECVFPHVTGKYLAFCDGDDFWTDVCKLQKQAEYLQTHQQCSCVYHPVNYLSGDTVISNDRISNKTRDVPIERLIEGGGLFCATAALFCRTEYALQYPKFREMADVADYPLQLYLALQGEFHYLPEIMACYRINVTGSWTQITEQPEQKIRHLQNEIAWLKEFDHYTQEQYSQAVSYRLLYYYLVMYRDGYCNFSEAKEIVAALQWSPWKVRALKKCGFYFFQRVLKHNFPGVYIWLRKLLRH